MYKLYNFEFDDISIRVVPINGEPWLSAQDVSQLATDASSQASYLVTKLVAERNVWVIRHQDIDFQDEKAQSHFASLTFVRAESVSNIAKEAEKDTSRFVEWLSTLERLLSEDDEDIDFTKDTGPLGKRWREWAEGVSEEGSDDHQEIQHQLTLLSEQVSALNNRVLQVENDTKDVSQINQKVNTILSRVGDIWSALSPAANGESKGALSRWLSKIT